MIRLYNKASIFCLPSLSEGFGLTILEAMTSGCAIVSTIDIGQCGLLIKPKSISDIVDKISYLVNNQKIVKKWGEKIGSCQKSSHGISLLKDFVEFMI